MGDELKWLVFRLYDAEAKLLTFRQADELRSAGEEVTIDQVGEATSRYTFTAPDADDVGLACGEGDFMLARADAFQQMRIVADVHYTEGEVNDEAEVF